MIKIYDSITHQLFTAGSKACVILLLGLLSSCNSSIAEIDPTSTPYPTCPPLPTYTPYPTLLPLPTYTPCPPCPDACETPIPDELTLWLDDQFDEGELDPNMWYPFGCEEARLSIGYIEFALSGDEKSCSLIPRSSDYTIEKIRATLIIENGSQGSSWSGIIASCGSMPIDFILTPSSTRYYGVGLPRKDVEFYTKLPISRTFILEWNGESLDFTIEDTGRNISVECSALPESVHIAVGIKEGGYANVRLDELQIWGSKR